MPPSWGRSGRSCGPPARRSGRPQAAPTSSGHSTPSRRRSACAHRRGSSSSRCRPTATSSSTTCRPPSGRPVRTARQCRRPRCRPTATSSWSGRAARSSGRRARPAMPGARLVLQDDGNAVVSAIDKRPLWSTGTAERRRDIGLHMQTQLQPNWCWSAVSTSVSQFYNPASAWTQCTLANAELEQTGCCADGSTPLCNKDWYLDRALTRTGNLQSWVGNPVALSDVEHEVNAGRPVGCAHRLVGRRRPLRRRRRLLRPRHRPGVPERRGSVLREVAHALLRVPQQLPGLGAWTHTYYTRS